METMCRILTIDAWRNTEGGWDWNSWHDTGRRYPVALLDAKPRAVLSWMRAHGLLSAASAGRVGTEDDGYNIVITERGNGRPLFAIEYGPVTE